KQNRPSRGRGQERERRSRAPVARVWRSRTEEPSRPRGARRRVGYTREVASKGRPYRSFSLDGYEVLVGKGDAENDELTFGAATPEDFWLHGAGVAGSHVVVRNPERIPALPPAVVERAAELAAWYSKARAARRVDVHLCRVADVVKPHGAPPGEVELRRWTRVRLFRMPDTSGSGRSAPPSR